MIEHMACWYSLLTICMAENEVESLRKLHGDRLQIFYADVLDYHNITDALKGCSGLFYTFEHPQSVAGYDVSY